jgi:hypothetical protein
MQGHRNDQIRLGQQRASGAFKPAREGGRGIQAVAMFETEDQAFGRIVTVLCSNRTYRHEAAEATP